MAMSAAVRVANISFRIGDFELKDVSLDVAEGEYFVLTGPNGAGKTMLVRLIAGLEIPLSGEISIGDAEVTQSPPWERSIGYVPQDGALFPNRDVRRNISFGLEVRRLDAETVSRRTLEVAEQVGAGHLLDRAVDGLSGGERQKVCLARALVVEPKVLLLDEPVSAIDETERDRLCAELKAVQANTGVTTVHVSHSRREAELVADRIGALENGVVRIDGNAPRSRRQ